MVWSPASTRWVTRHTMVASTPSRIGTPSGPGCQAPWAANRSMPLVANVRATCSCSWVSTCTATVPAASTAGQADAVLARQNETSGGSSETEVKEVAVKPAGGAPGAVMTTTAAAWRRSSARNRSGFTARSWWRGVTVMGCPLDGDGPAVSEFLPDERDEVAAVVDGVVDRVVAAD